MVIDKFKAGDIITRVDKAIYLDGQTDSSHIGDPFEFVGYNKSKIVLLSINQWSESEHSIKVFDTDIWSNGWDYYPIKELDEAKRRLISIAKAFLFEEELEKSSKYKKGQLVKTNDGRWGFIKEIDWHAVKVLKIKSYQIKFPDGVGIFKEDEFEIVNDPMNED